MVRSKGSKKQKPLWLKITTIVALVLFVGVVIYGITFYRSLSSALEDIHEPIDRKTDKRAEEVTLEKKEPFSVLMLGVDEREGDRGRSDTMIVLTINPNQNSTKMLSIPRDTRTDIVGHGIVDKINHAYAFGGPEMSMDTVENFLDIPIDYYMRINMEGFKDIVDAVGGVTVNNNLDFSNGGSNFPVGEITLDGTNALNYIQMRKQDPNGDFGRQQRQRLVVQAVIRKGASLNSITNFGPIFDALGSNIKTNLTFNEMVEIQKNYKNASQNIEHVTISGQGTMIDGIYYLQVADQEKQRVQDILKNHLELITEEPQQQ